MFLSTCQKMLSRSASRFCPINPSILLEAVSRICQILFSHRQNHLEEVQTTSQEWFIQRPHMRWRSCTTTKPSASTSLRLTQRPSFPATRWMGQNTQLNYSSGVQSNCPPYLKWSKDGHTSLHHLDKGESQQFNEIYPNLRVRWSQLKGWKWPWGKLTPWPLGREVVWWNWIQKEKAIRDMTV